MVLEKERCWKKKKEKEERDVTDPIHEPKDPRDRLEEEKGLMEEPVEVVLREEARGLIAVRMIPSATNAMWERYKLFALVETDGKTKLIW